MPVLKVKKNGIWEEVSGGSSVEVDASLSVEGQAADAKAVGDALAGKQPVGNYATKDYVDSTISAIPTPDVSGQINTHNTAIDSHSDIRVLISDLSAAVNNFLDVDDTTTDQLSEVLALINANKGTLESLTTSKVNISDIINNLTTNSSNKVLSAAQGVAIKALIDTLQTEVNKKANASNLTAHTGNKSNPHGVTAAQVGAVPLSGVSDYSITGSLTFSDSGTTSGAFKGLQGKCGSNDYWHVGGSQTGNNAGYMEIATADDGNEPIYVRQYTGVYSTLTRTATLLDGSGNTSFPGRVTAAGATLTNSLNLANGIWNKAGDDAYFGDNNTAGAFAIKGQNGNTNLKMVSNSSDNNYATITYDSTNECLNFAFV